MSAHHPHLGEVQEPARTAGSDVIHSSRMRYCFRRTHEPCSWLATGAIGAVVARFVHTEEVTGSNPVSPTLLSAPLRVACPPPRRIASSLLARSLPRCAPPTSPSHAADATRRRTELPRADGLRMSL